MGRGRAKAKQTKVARRLKYYSPDTDLTALERELAGQERDPFAVAVPRPDDDADDADDEQDDPYARYAGGYGDEDDDEDDRSSRGA